MKRFYALSGNEIWTRYHTTPPIPEGLYEYLDTERHYTHYVFSYSQFKQTLQRKRKVWYRDRESQQHISNGTWIRQFTAEMQDEKHHIPLDALSQFLGADVATIAAALHCPADEFLDFQREHKMLENVNPVYYEVMNEQSTKWVNDRKTYEENFVLRLIPGNGDLTWREKALLSKINTIHSSTLLPAPHYTMAELVVWLYEGKPSVPRWAYWFYNSDGSLRTDSPYIRRNSPSAWVAWWWKTILNANTRTYRRTTLEIPEGDHDGL